MQAVLIYVAALGEIAGCFAVWVWSRLGQSPLRPVPGMRALAAFAWLLALSPADRAGRACAVQGGICMGASLLWL